MPARLSPSVQQILRRVRAARAKLESRIRTSSNGGHRDAQQQLIRQAMLAHDMVTHADEGYYRDRYRDWITACLAAVEVDRSGRFLDAGCGPGRLAIPLAEEVAPAGGTVIGVDFVPELVGDARRYGRDSGVTNVEFVESDVIEFLQRSPEAAYAAALCLEVPFVVPDLDALLRGLARVLRPGGLLLASFRTRYFLGQLGVALRDWDLADRALAEPRGPLGGMGWQNRAWTHDVIADLSNAGFSGIELAGIGNTSGIDGDPLARLARPSKLSDAELTRLARVEHVLGNTHPDAGRYILAAATRSAQ